MVTIYYKDNQLDKYRTLKSIVKYYLTCLVRNIKPSKIIVHKSLDTTTYAVVD